MLSCGCNYIQLYDCMRSCQCAARPWRRVLHSVASPTQLAWGSCCRCCPARAVASCDVIVPHVFAGAVTQPGGAVTQCMHTVPPHSPAVTSQCCHTAWLWCRAVQHVQPGCATKHCSHTGRSNSAARPAAGVVHPLHSTWHRALSQAPGTAQAHWPAGWRVYLLWPMAYGRSLMSSQQWRWCQCVIHVSVHQTFPALTPPSPPPRAARSAAQAASSRPSLSPPPPSCQAEQELRGGAQGSSTARHKPGHTHLHHCHYPPTSSAAQHSAAQLRSAAQTASPPPPPRRRRPPWCTCA